MGKKRRKSSPISFVKILNKEVNIPLGNLITRTSNWIALASLIFAAFSLFVAIYAVFIVGQNVSLSLHDISANTGNFSSLFADKAKIQELEANVAHLNESFVTYQNSINSTSYNLTTVNLSITKSLPSDRNFTIYTDGICLFVRAPNGNITKLACDN
ncbi:MAG: hypothetical protein WC517_04650 [Patescibacteria group bacterium]